MIHPSAHKTVEVEKLTIPLTDLKNISDGDRYSYYLLGHMFNELMCLQKLIFFTMPRHEDERDIRRRPEMSQAVFLFRMALSKINEVKNEFSNNEVLKATFATLIFPKWAEGQTRLEQLNSDLEAAPWLSRLRNKVGFHFPTFGQLKPFVQPNENWDGDEIYLSTASGNVFYDGANAVMMHWMFSLYGTENPIDAINPMIREMIDLIKQVTRFLEDALGVLIADSMLSSNNVRAPGGVIMSPKFEGVEIPFWTSMPPATGTI